MVEDLAFRPVNRKGITTHFEAFKCTIFFYVLLGFEQKGLENKETFVLPPLPGKRKSSTRVY